MNKNAIRSDDANASDARVTAVADAIRALFYLTSQASWFAYAFVDYIKLLYFDDIRIRLIDKAGSVRLDSLSHNDAVLLTTRYGAVDGKAPPIIYRDARTDVTIEVSFLPGAKQSSNYLQILFDQKLTPYDAKDVFETLQEFVTQPDTSEREKAKVISTSVSATDVESALAPFVQEYSGFTESFSVRRLWIGDEVHEQVSSVFAVVRYLPSQNYLRTVAAGDNLLKYNYAARVLLDRGQMEWLGRRFGAHAPDVFQAVVGDTARFVGDSVFESGLVECGDLASARHTRERGTGSQVDEQRSLLETQVYDYILRGGNQRFFSYMPVHVGGVPWAALYAFGNEKHSPTHFLHLYRQFIPHLAHGIRIAARNGYIKHLITHIRKAVYDFLARPSGDLAEARRVTDELNDQFLKAALVYPLPRLHVRIGPGIRDDGSDSLDLHRIPFTFSAGRSLWPNASTDIGVLNGEALITNCVSGADEALADHRKALIDRAEDRVAAAVGFYGVGHNLSHRADVPLMSCSRMLEHVGELKRTTGGSRPLEVIAHETLRTHNAIQSIRRIGILLDLFGSVISSGNDTNELAMDAGFRKYFNAKQLWLNDALDKAARESFSTNPQNPGRALAIKSELANEIHIGGFFRTHQGEEVRFDDVFYTAIFQEICVNAATNYHPVHLPAVLTVSKRESWLVFSNPCTRHAYEQLGGADPNDTRDWLTRRRTGGIAYIYLWLQSLKAGEVQVKADTDGANETATYWFEIALRLKGMR